MGLPKTEGKVFLPWEGPYVVLERTSEVKYKVAELGQLRRWRILQYKLLKSYLEQIGAYNLKEKMRTTFLVSKVF